MTYDLSYTDALGNDLCERYTLTIHQQGLTERLNELSKQGISFYLRLAQVSSNK